MTKESSSSQESVTTIELRKMLEETIAENLHLKEELNGKDNLLA